MGKTFRLIEWDLHASPQEPDGAMVRVTMPLQLTRGKLRQAVANSYGLESSKGVKQFAHSFVFNAKVFYEKLEDNSAIANLPDGEVLVWTQVCLPSHPCIHLAFNYLSRHPFHHSLVLQSTEKGMLANRVIAFHTMQSHCLKFESVWQARLTCMMMLQVSPSQLQIPSRSDRLPSKTDVGISIEGSSERKTPAQVQEALIMDAITLVCKLSRQEMPSLKDATTSSVVCSQHLLQTVLQVATALLRQLRCCTNNKFTMRVCIPSSFFTILQEIPASKAHATIDLAHSSPSGNANGAHVVATAMQPVAQPEQPPHPPLSAAWLLSLKEPALVKQVQESIADLERISRQVESEMIAAVVDSDHVVVKLYTFSGEKDVFAFVSYVRAHLIRTGRVKS